MQKEKGNTRPNGTSGSEGLISGQVSQWDIVIKGELSKYKLERITKSTS